MQPATAESQIPAVHQSPLVEATDSADEDAQETEQDSWNCAICDTSNCWKRLSCWQCYRVHADISMWECPRCTYHNSKTTNKCICDAWNDTIIHKKRRRPANRTDKDLLKAYKTKRHAHAPSTRQPSFHRPLVGNTHTPSSSHSSRSTVSSFQVAGSMKRPVVSGKRPIAARVPEARPAAQASSNSDSESDEEFEFMLPGCSQQPAATAAPATEEDDDLLPITVADEEAWQRARIEGIAIRDACSLLHFVWEQQLEFFKHRIDIFNGRANGE